MLGVLCVLTQCASCSSRSTTSVLQVCNEWVPSCLCFDVVYILRQHKQQQQQQHSQRASGIQQLGATLPVLWCGVHPETPQTAAAAAQSVHVKHDMLTKSCDLESVVIAMVMCLKMKCCLQVREVRALGVMAN